MVKCITCWNELDAELKSAGPKLIVVDFGAKWCGPCRMIAPIFESLAGQHPDVVFLKVDIDQAPELAQCYGIRGVPCFIFFKNGQQIDCMTGANQAGLCQKISCYK